MLHSCDKASYATRAALWSRTMTQSSPEFAITMGGALCQFTLNNGTSPRPRAAFFPKGG